MSADTDTDKAHPDDTCLERLRAVPVVDLRPVIAPQEASVTEKEQPPAPVPEETDSLQAATPPPDHARDVSDGWGKGGWIVPFLGGALAGASVFYAVLWLRALI